MNKNLLMFTLFLLVSTSLFGQSKPYTGPNDPAGDKNVQRIGYMTGNRVFIYFKNTTEMSACCGTQYSKWPNNDDGYPMTDGVALWIGAETYVSQDTIPSPWSPTTDTLFFVQTNYREHIDVNRNGNLAWTLWPPRGYANEDSEFLAMSNIPDSWPINGWPTGNGLQYSGLWNGRFGWGKVSAQLETFFVANDAQDQEYLQPDRRTKYYPRPNQLIGDLDPNVTTNVGQPWGGLGVRVETRGMQWSNPQSQDAIFWEYTIANISDYDIPKTAFGYYIDMGIGQNEEYDEVGFYNTVLDLAFAWDIDNVSTGGRQPGLMGVAFLESPGNSNDLEDNDEDGIVDEKRDNAATTFYEDPFQNPNLVDAEAFKFFYSRDPGPHWDADEDGDWTDGQDLNGDGIYNVDLGEFPGDDVGVDGISPLDFLIYPGPDADGTEGNHRPDLNEATFKSEPNFAYTDVSESDMIGLTTFLVDALPGPDEFQPKNDKIAWQTMSANTFQPWFDSPDNLCMLFSASPFPLYQGQTEHISMSMVHSLDFVTGSVIDPDIPLLARKKEVVQTIYERDYRFATPPEMPTLTATPADGKVILSWNDVAEKFTVEPLLNNINDFEGYKIYKATDKYFSDAELITNGFGEPTLRKPIYQRDIVNGKKGFTDFGLVDGIAYYLGRDSGIDHYYIDENVKNGVTYYYALVAYDYGIPDIGEGITPFENSVVLDVDEYGGIRNQGINVAIVIPTQMAAGYVPPLVEVESGLDENSLISINPISLNVVDHLSVSPGKKYKVKWKTTEVDSLKAFSRRSNYDTKFITSGFEVTEVSDSGEITLFVEDTTKANYVRENMISDNYSSWPNKTLHYPIDIQVLSSLTDGVQVGFTPTVLDPTVDPNKSGWVVGESNMNVLTGSQSSFFPWEYEIVFTDDPSVYKTKTTFARSTLLPNGERPSESQFLLNQEFNFYVINKSFTDSTGNPVPVDLMVYDADSDGSFDILNDQILVGHEVVDGSRVRWGGTILGIDFNDISNENDLPKAGDVYRVSFTRPLGERDSVIFTVKEPVNVVNEVLNKDMDEINVVPNPYIATNQMEPNLTIRGLNQQRRLLFTNLPALCTIKIFTVSGVFVDEIIVENTAEKGTAYWDMLTKEGLEIASGMYIYHVESEITGKEKIGKFAVLK